MLTPSIKSKVAALWDKFNVRMNNELSEVEKDYISNIEMKANQKKWK